MKKESSTALRREITNAARAAFLECRAAHPAETFYVYALFTDMEANSIGASANTEEGLVRRAREYGAIRRQALADQARLLRWNAPDWTYHCTGGKQFETAQKLLDSRWKSVRRGIDADEQEVEKRLEIFINALKTLDDEGFFGRGAARHKVTLLVTMGDQETKLLLECARRLNPRKVYEPFSRPFIQSTAGKFKGIGSRKTYQSVAVAVSQNGKMLACCGSAHSGWPCLFAFALPAQREILRLLLKETIALRGLALSPDGTSICSGWQSLRPPQDTGIQCWDVKTKRAKWEVKSPAGGCLDVSTDGAVVASGSENGLIYFRHAGSGELIRQISGHQNPIECVRFSPAGAILASCDRAKSICIWDFNSGKRAGQIADFGSCIAFSPDGQFLAVVSRKAKNKRDVSIWEVGNGRLVARLDAVTKSRFQATLLSDDHQDCETSSVAFSPCGRFLAVARSWPGSVVLWDWRSRKELTWMNPDYESINGLAFLPDGKTVAVAGRSMSGPPLLLWDVSEAVKMK